MNRREGAQQSGAEIVRDPLWNTIPLDAHARSLVDTPEFQRLRRVRQLGLAFLVYPGANHTRFDHALGVYHLTRRALRLLDERGELADLDPGDCRLVPYAGLLHDIGHYPFSHAVEELEAGLVPGHHEALSGRFLGRPDLAGGLEAIGPGAAARIEAMIRGRSGSPLQGMVAGSLDLDKIEYLKRDARFCGVPYGEVDVDRLLHALAVLRDPATGRLEIGIEEKGISALESLLFAKYQMFRNVYWHHTVRAATALFKRLVERAVRSGAIQPDEMVGQSDEGFLALLESRATAMGGPAGDAIVGALAALRDRRLPKRAVEIPGELVRGLPCEAWLYGDAALQRALEDSLARELDVPAGEVLLDYPQKPRMMELDLLLRTREGRVERLTGGGFSGLIDLPRISEELYYSARTLRVFAPHRRSLDPERLLSLLRLPAETLRQRLGEGAAPPEPSLS